MMSVTAYTPPSEGNILLGVFFVVAFAISFMKLVGWINGTD